MRQLFTFLFFGLMAQGLWAQTLTVDPNEGFTGQELPITIMGEGTQFTNLAQGSNVLIYFEQGSDLLYTYWSEVVSDTEIVTELPIPFFAQAGNYDLFVNDTQGFPVYLQTNAFTILESKIDTIIPNQASKGETLDITIFGENTLFDQGSSAVWFTQGSSSSIYPSQTVVVDNETIEATFTIPFDAECGVYRTHATQQTYIELLKESSFTVNCGNQISGSVYVDENTNNEYNLNDGETGWSGAKVHVMPGDYFIATDNNGDYVLDIGPGEYTLTAIPPNYYNTPFPTETITITEEGQSVSQVDFALIASESVNDLRISLTGGQATAGLPNTYWVNVQNVGTTTVGGNIEVTLDDLLMYESASVAPNEEDGQTLSWNLAELAPNEEMMIAIYVTVDVAIFGTPLNCEAEVIPLDAEDATPLNNKEILSEELLASYDPNDKLVASTGETLGDLILLEDDLVYTIRFQNTGNAPAINIYIEDPIDSNLDISTLEVIGASHMPYSVELKDDYSVVFRFNNIFLPDSTSNPAGSNGFIKYIISPKENLEIGTTVENTGYIFFDFNDAVVTNTVENTLVEELPLGLNVINDNTLISANPNPFNERATIVLSTPDNSINAVHLYDLTGKLVRTEKINNPMDITIERGDLDSGVYLYHLIGNQTYTGKVVVQ